MTIKELHMLSMYSRVRAIFKSKGMTWGEADRACTLHEASFADFLKRAHTSDRTNLFYLTEKADRINAREYQIRT